MNIVITNHVVPSMPTPEPVTVSYPANDVETVDWTDPESVLVRGCPGRRSWVVTENACTLTIRTEGGSHYAGRGKQGYSKSSYTVFAKPDGFDPQSTCGDLVRICSFER